MKSALEDAAGARKTSVARLLAEIVDDWLGGKSESESDEKTQERLHAAAKRCFGKLEGADPLLAQEARQRVRAKLRRRHAS